MLKQISNLDWATIYSKYLEKRSIFTQEQFIEEEVRPLLGFSITLRQLRYQLKKYETKNIINQEKREQICKILGIQDPVINDAQFDQELLDIAASGKVNKSKH